MDKADQIQMDPSILWHDEAILLVNKPAGMLTIRDGYKPNLPYLIQILSKQFGRIWVVHRLDRDTSGACLVALSAQSHQNLNGQFEHRRVKKIYHAITIGIPDQEHFTIDAPLKVNGDRKHRTVIDQQNGKNASTEFTILERYSRYCLLEARPQTGYTHQIRAHLSFAGYPLLADSLYNPKSSQQDTTLMQRMALHAYSISFSHPMTGKLIEIQAPYPQDFDNCIRLLRESC